MPRGKPVNCIVTGCVMRANGGDYLVINYTSEDGCHIEGAEIPRSAFHIYPPNAKVDLTGDHCGPNLKKDAPAG